MAGIVAKNDRTKVFIAEAGEAEFTLADKVGKLTNIGDITSTDEDVEVTGLESDTKEYETGIPDNGTLELTQNLTSSEYDDMMEYKENETDLKIGIAITNKAGELVVGRSCAHAKVTGVTLGGMSVGGVITVVTTFRLNAKLVPGFTIPLT